MCTSVVLFCFQATGQSTVVRKAETPQTLSPCCALTLFLFFSLPKLAWTCPGIYANSRPSCNISSVGCVCRNLPVMQSQVRDPRRVQRISCSSAHRTQQKRGRSHSGPWRTWSGVWTLPRPSSTRTSTPLGWAARQTNRQTPSCHRSGQRKDLRCLARKLRVK